MNLVFHYLLQYFRTVNKFLLLLFCLLAALMISLNYSLGLESMIRGLSSQTAELAAFFFLYAAIFISAYGISFAVSGIPFPQSRRFYVFLLAAPLLFAFKIGWRQIAAPLAECWPAPWNQYAMLVLDWPLRAALLLLIIIILWRGAKWQGPVAGLSLRGQNLWPYLGLLLLMLPLLAFAASQPDFQQVYPKLKKMAFLYPHLAHKGPWQLLYELAYGTDFFSIELFFRGFLVLLFARYVGKEAILPMALFYCSIHFGKPLFECISSFPGGLLLGIVVYNTRSIWGGLLVHLGIAWLMELGGYLAAQAHG